MNRVVLTEARCRATKPGPRRRFIPDALAPGLILQITPRGHRSFMLRGIWPGGRNRVRRLLGEVGVLSLENARTQARDWLALLAQGRDPQLELSERKRQALAENSRTFSIVADAYIADRLRGQRQGARSAREIRDELVTRWGERAVGSISRGDIVQLVDDLRERARRSVGAGRMSGAHARCIFSHAACRATGRAISYSRSTSAASRSAASPSAQHGCTA